MMLLTILTFLPAVFALFIIVSRCRGATKFFFYLSIIITALITIYLYFNFDKDFNINLAIAPLYGLYYGLSLNGINLVILLIIALVVPLISLIDHKLENDNFHTYFANILLAQTAFMLAVLGDNLIIFYIGFEIMLVPIFIIFTLKADSNFDLKEIKKAGFNMFYYTAFGSLFMLLAILILGSIFYAQFGAISFRAEDLREIIIDGSTQAFLAFLFILAFALKLPIFPFHGWLKDAYSKSPSAGAFLLSAVASKIAIYGLISIVLVIFSTTIKSYGLILAIMGVFSLIYFAIANFIKKDLKSLLAYSSASHLGLMFAGVMSLDFYAINGSSFMMLSHAMSIGALFVLSSKIYDAYGNADMRNLGGIAKDSPLFALFFGIALFSSIALPITNGFIGEFLIFVGLFEFNIFLAMIAVSSVILGAVYMLRMFKNTILIDKKTDKKLAPLKFKEIIAFSLLSFFIIYLGVHPNPLLDKIESGTMQLVEGGMR